MLKKHEKIPVPNFKKSLNYLVRDAARVISYTTEHITVGILWFSIFWDRSGIL